MFKPTASVEPRLAFAAGCRTESSRVHADAIGQQLMRYQHNLHEHPLNVFASQEAIIQASTKRMVAIILAGLFHPEQRDHAASRIVTSLNGDTPAGHRRSRTET
jgi:hypothetical protein